MVKNNLNFFSRAVNLLFHPVFMPFYFFAILLFLSSMMINNPLSVKLSILRMVGFITILMPAVSVGISSLINRLAGERGSTTYFNVLASSVLLVSYVLAIVILKNYITLKLSWRLFLAPLIIIILYHLFRIIRFRFSVWTAAMGALFSFLYLLSISGVAGLTAVIIATVIVAGVVGSARMYDGKDALTGVAVGYFIGILSSVLSFYLPTLW